MNIHQLRCAVTVARLGSQTRAAEALYMSQPNLSKAIKELEQTCGFRIFARAGNGMAPTLRGEEFLERARNILEQMDALDAIYQSRSRGTSYLSLAVPRAGYITRAVTEYVNALNAQEGMDLLIREGSTQESIEAVINREADIGIVRYSMEQQNKVLGQLLENGLSYILYWSFRPVVLLSQRHPLARKEKLEAGALKSYIEIVQGDELQLSGNDAGMGEIRRRIRINERGSQLELISSMPSAYMWSSPTPADLLKRYGLVQLPSEDVSQEYQDALIYLKGYQLSRWEQSFYDLVRKEIDRL